MRQLACGSQQVVAAEGIRGHDAALHPHGHQRPPIRRLDRRRLHARAARHQPKSFDIAGETGGCQVTYLFEPLYHQQVPYPFTPKTQEPTTCPWTVFCTDLAVDELL
jgi:hypothetical protein